MSAVAGFAIMVFGLTHPEDPYGMACWLAGLGSSLLAMGLVVFFVRCPTCGMRWVWAAVKNERHDRWMRWLMTLQTCPGCEKRSEAAASVPT